MSRVTSTGTAVWLALAVVAWAAQPGRAGAAADAGGDRRRWPAARPGHARSDAAPGRLASRGVRFTAHHAVYPTVTRVNAATFVTGVLPARHGLLGNSIYIPSVDPVRPIDTADHEALLKVAAAEGQLLTAPTLGQMLATAGKRLLVVSSGSSDRRCCSARPTTPA